MEKSVKLVVCVLAGLGLLALAKATAYVKQRHDQAALAAIQKAKTHRVAGMALDLGLGERSTQLLAKRQSRVKRSSELAAARTVAPVTDEIVPVEDVLAANRGAEGLVPATGRGVPSVNASIQAAVTQADQSSAWGSRPGVARPMPVSASDPYLLTTGGNLAIDVVDRNAPPGGDAVGLGVLTIKPGQSVSELLGEFVKAHGWQLSWDADEYIVSTQVSLSGSLESVTDALIRALNHSGARLKSVLYEGNKTLRVSERN